MDAGGWLVRAYFDTSQQRTDYRKAPRFAALPYLRLVNEVTGHSYPESYDIPDFAAESARLETYPLRGATTPVGTKPTRRCHS